MVRTIPSLAVLLGAGMIGSGVYADSLASINHVVLFMQENRAFDHVWTRIKHEASTNALAVLWNNGGSPRIF